MYQAPNGRDFSVSTDREPMDVTAIMGHKKWDFNVNEPKIVTYVQLTIDGNTRQIAIDEWQELVDAIERARA